MDRMVLTQSQIDRIFEFTAQKYIKYYDVQLELVDHVASRIEDMMAADAQLQFEVALQRVYKSFGVFGFTKVQNERVSELEGYWRRKLWICMKRYFTLPLLIFTLLLSILILSLLLYAGSYAYHGILICSMLAAGIYKICGNRVAIKHKTLYQHSFSQITAGCSTAVCYPLFMSNVQGLFSAHLWVVYFVAFYIAVFIILIWVVVVELPRHMDEQLRLRYEHLNLVL